jgi:outer membrane usher protein
LALTSQRAGAVDACSTLPPPAKGITELLLTLKVAGDGEDLRSVLRSGDHFLVDELALHAWRIERLPKQRTTYAGLSWYALDAIPGLRFRFDNCAQSLRVDLGGVARAPLQYSISAAIPKMPAAVADRGGYLNFDLLYTRIGAQDEFGTLGEAVLFGGSGRFTQTFLTQNTDFKRLDTNWAREWPEHLYTLTLGDSVSSAGAWGRALRYGGIRFATDFSLQPYFVPFPQPTVRGGAALPSTLDVFINDSLRARQDVGEGPFELHNLPTLTGGGEAVLVMRDALGRATQVTVPFYVSPQLLKPGLFDFAIDAGAQRRNYGLRSADYADPFFAGTARKGLTDRFTGELRVEARRDTGALGAGAFWLVDHFGLLSATAAYSGGRGNGGQAGIGVERNIFGKYSLALRTTWAQPDFHQLGQPDDERAARHVDFASLSFVPHPGATLAFAYAHEDRRDRDDLSLRTIGYTSRLGRSWLLGLSAVEARASTVDRSLIASLSYQFSNGVSADLQREFREHASDAWRGSVQRNMRGPLDWGARVDVQTGEFRHEDVRAEWGTRYGRFSGEAVDDVSGRGLRLDASAALVYLGGDAYLTRPVQGSFAVVHAGGLSNVGVYQDNRLVGRTGAGGSALIPELRPYQENSISLHADEVPIEWPLESLRRSAIPRGRSGLVVDFNPGARIGAEFTLIDAQGKPIPSGVIVKDALTGERYPIGSDGQIYVRARPGPRELRIKGSNLQCVAKVIVRAQTAGEPVAIACLPEKP